MLPDFLIEKAKNDKLNPIARARVFKKLIDRFGLKTGEIAKRIGKSSSYVSNALRLLSLPEALKDGLVAGFISSGHGRALAAISNKRKMITAYKQVLRQEGTVRMAEALARKITRRRRRKAKTDPLLKIKKEIAQALDGATEPLLKKIHSLLTKPNLLKGQ